MATPCEGGWAAGEALQPTLSLSGLHSLLPLLLPLVLPLVLLLLLLLLGLPCSSGMLCRGHGWTWALAATLPQGQGLEPPLALPGERLQPE